MKYLLDTNVICELRKKRANIELVQWIKNVNKDSLYISCISIGEIKEGIIKKNKQDVYTANVLSVWLSEIMSIYKEHILNIDTVICEQWGELLSIDKTNAVDALIAAQAICNNMILVTRNVKHFKRFAVRLWNPFMDD